MEDGTLDLKELYGHSCASGVLSSLEMKGMKSPVMKEPYIEQCDKMTFNCCTNDDMVKI